MMFVVMSQIHRYVVKQVHLMGQLVKHIMLISNLVWIIILVVGGGLGILVEMSIAIPQVQLGQ